MNRKNNCDLYNIALFNQLTFFLAFCFLLYKEIQATLHFYDQGWLGITKCRTEWYDALFSLLRITIVSKRKPISY